ncbi:hypothetical protein Lal_00033931 [Lupinus albus]|nr:hypothetical protein Lal_00033931 [Lupinus albus]
MQLKCINLVYMDRTTLCWEKTMSSFAHHPPPPPFEQRAKEKLEDKSTNNNLGKNIVFSSVRESVRISLAADNRLHLTLSD